MTKVTTDKISCIIPAYNEGKRISKVISVLKDHKLIDELIVLNDGSTDNTSEVIRQFKGIRIIDLKENRGKSYTVYTGIKMARNELIMLIDADLIGLNKKNITDLIMPVLEKKADVSISLRANAPLISRMLGIDFISGERIFHKGMIDDYKKISELSGFGLEVFLNKKIIDKRLRVKIVIWDNVESPYPVKKWGFIRGNLRFIGMIGQIIKTAGIFGTLHQIIRMRSLMI